MIEETIASGSTVRFNITGRNFRLIETFKEVDVFFYRRGALIANAVRVEAGYSERWDRESEGYDQIAIKSNVTQDVKFASRTESEVSYDRMVGAISVNNWSGGFATFNPAVGTVSMTLRPGAASRRYLRIQNRHATGSLYINPSASPATVSGGMKIGPGGSLEMATFLPTGSITAIASVAMAVGDVVVWESI